MKISEFRKLIREEVKSILAEDNDREYLKQQVNKYNVKNNGT